MSFIKNDPIPVNSMKSRTHSDDRIRCNHDVDKVDICRVTIWSVPRLATQRWSKLGNFINPLGDDGFRDDDQSLPLLVTQDGRNQLHRLSKTHFITEETTLRLTDVVFHGQHPHDTFLLIGCIEPSSKKRLRVVIQLFNHCLIFHWMSVT